MRTRRKFLVIILAEILAAAGANRLAENLLRRSLGAALETGDRERLARIYSALSSIEERRDNLSQAADLLKKAIETEPDFEFLGFHHCDLAFIYKSQGEYSLAAGHFEETLRLLGSDVSPRYRNQIEEEFRICREKVSARK